MWGGCNPEDDPQGGRTTIDGFSFNIEKSHQTNMGYDAERNRDKIVLTLEASTIGEDTTLASNILELNFWVPFPDSVIIAGRYSVAANTLWGTLKTDSIYELDNTTTVRVTTTNGKKNYSITLSGKTTAGQNITATYDGEIPYSSLASVGTGEVSFSSDSTGSSHDILYAWQSSAKTADDHCRQCFDMLVKDNIRVAVTITHTTDVWRSTLQGGATVGQTDSMVTTCKVYHNQAWASLLSGEMQLAKGAGDSYTVSMNNGIAADSSKFSFSYSGTLAVGSEWEVNKVVGPDPTVAIVQP